MGGTDVTIGAGFPLPSSTPYRKKTDRMAIELKQQLRISQQLVMTPQLQQAIKLLQLNQQELVDLVQDELQEGIGIVEAARLGGVFCVLCNMGWQHERDGVATAGELAQR